MKKNLMFADLLTKKIAEPDFEKHCKKICGDDETKECLHEVGESVSIGVSVGHSFSPSLSKWNYSVSVECVFVAMLAYVRLDCLLIDPIYNISCLLWDRTDHVVKDSLPNGIQLIMWIKTLVCGSVPLSPHSSSHNLEPSSK